MRSTDPRYDRDTASFTGRQRQWNAIPSDGTVLLGKITAASAISNYRWTYTWDEAQISGTTPSVRTDGLTSQTALSMSELSNGAPPTTYAYGVPSTDLTGTFVPKQIPVGAYVPLFAFRKADGSLLWLIINVQAISGACP
jgi:hypothetical protein